MQDVSDETSVLSDAPVALPDVAEDKAGGDKPWTVRGVPPEARNAAIAAAKRSDVNIGAWLTRAVRVAVKAEREESRAVATVGAAPLPVCPVADVQVAFSVAQQLSEATGKPVPRRIARAIQKQLLANLGVPQREASRAS